MRQYRIPLLTSLRNNVLNVLSRKGGFTRSRLGSLLAAPVGFDVANKTLLYEVYRIFCVLLAVLCLAFGAIYRLTEPTAVDPLWIRLFLAAGAVTLIALSFIYKWTVDRFVGLVHGYFYVVTIWFISLTVVNGFTSGYTIGLLFTMTAVGVAFSVGLDNTVRPLFHYLLFTIGVTVSVLVLLPGLEANVPLLSASLISTALIIYFVAYSRMQTEQAVKASEQRYQTLMNAANDAIFIAAPHSGRLIDANEKAQELTGRSLEELRQMHYADLFPEDEREHYTELFEEHIFESAHLREELFLANRNGYRIPVNVNASIVNIGEESLIQGTFRDITASLCFQAELEARTQAEEMLRLKTSFLNNMSHELRTPLASILGYAEVLSEEVQDGQEYVGTITESARRLQRTLDSVLDLARLENGQTELTPEPLDIVQETREAIKLLKPLAESKGLNLTLSTPLTALPTCADAGCLSRIINNLVGNAIKFTEEGGVTVEVDGDPQHVYLRVRDTGIGITDEFLEHLFDEFRQESTGLARSHEGSGLGLAITKRLVDLMEGTIDVDSTKGVGTVFSVSFPRTALDTPCYDPSEETRRQNQQLARLDDLSVLIVEDDPNMRGLLVRTLQPACAGVQSTSDPESALACAAETRFGLLLIDINLETSQDGVDVLRTLRTLTGYQNTPALAVTAYAMPGDKEQLLQAGFDHYLSKPFTKKQLLQALRETQTSHELIRT